MNRRQFYSRYLPQRVIAAFEASRLAAPRLQAGELEFDIFGYIGDFEEDDVNEKQLASFLRAAGGRDVVVNINSPGGTSLVGFAMYNLLKNYDGGVAVKIFGMFQFIHHAWGFTIGAADDMRSAAESLDKLDNALIDIIDKRGDFESRGEVASVVDMERDWTTQECRNMGLCDGLLEDDDLSQMSAVPRASKLAEAASDLLFTMRANSLAAKFRDGGNYASR